MHVCITVYTACVLGMMFTLRVFLWVLSSTAGGWYVCLLGLCRFPSRESPCCPGSTTLPGSAGHHWRQVNWIRLTWTWTGPMVLAGAIVDYQSEFAQVAKTVRNITNKSCKMTGSLLLFKLLNFAAFFLWSSLRCLSLQTHPSDWFLSVLLYLAQW